MGKKRFEDYEVGDIIESVMPPVTQAQHSTVAWGPQWYFRLWRATVVSVKCGVCAIEVQYDVHEPEVLEPDDSRVVAFLRDNYTPPKHMITASRSQPHA
jgi:hypothetical protein